MGINKITQRETILSTLGGEVKIINFLDTQPNVFQIRNFTVGTIYISDKENVSNTFFELQVQGNGSTALYINPRGLKQIYLYCNSAGNVKVNSFESDEIYGNDLDKTLQSVIVNMSATSVSLNSQIPEGVNHIGKVEIDIPLPAGTNNIGKVEVSNIPEVEIKNDTGNAIPIKDTHEDANNNKGVVLKDSTGTEVGTVAKPLQVETTVNVGAVSVDFPSTPSITTVVMTDANTEYSAVIPANCKLIRFSVRDGAGIFSYRFAFETGKVATPVEPYKSYKGNVEYDSGILKMGSVPSTLYFACTEAGHVLEIELWT